ncbi:MAG: plastocyanin/azurin family copper-binding protein [Halobacteriales archaeon]
MRRRTFLQRSSVLAALGLAGCTGDDQGATETAPPATDTRSATPETGPETTSPGATPTASPTDTAASASEPSTGTDSSSPTPTRTPTETPTSTPTPRPAVSQEVKVGPGSLTFEPNSFQIMTGETVRWVWKSGGHNVKPSAVPDGADWTGTAGGEYDTYGEGHVYSYTFDVAGTYEYYCAPHRSSGMTGSFTVG